MGAALCLAAIGDSASAAVPHLLDLVEQWKQAVAAHAKDLLGPPEFRAAKVSDLLAAARAAVFIGVKGEDSARLAVHLSLLQVEIGRHHRPVGRDHLQIPRPQALLDDPNVSDDEAKAELRMLLAALAPEAKAALVDGQPAAKKWDKDRGYVLDVISDAEKEWSLTERVSKTPMADWEKVLQPEELIWTLQGFPMLTADLKVDEMLHLRKKYTGR